MGRAPCCDKASVKRGPWSPEEDARLKAYIEEHGAGGNWIALPHKIGLNRCGKSCRLRWLNYLRPNIRHGGFSEEEDNIICSLYISIGSRWSIIAAQLPGRTDNDIKNYWNTKLKKKLLGRCKEPHSRRISSSSPEERKEPVSGSNNETFPQGFSATALERMQLHMQLQGLHSSFSFFNNPALWPKFHPLADRILRSQQYDAVDAAVNEVLPDSNATIEASRRASFPNNSEPSTCMVDNNLGDLDATSSLNGFSSSSSSIALNMEQSNASFNPASCLQAELDELLYGKNGYYGVQAGEQPLGVFDCFRGMNGHGEGAVWCADIDVFEEKSPSSSWGSASVIHPESMFQELMLGYDI